MRHTANILHLLSFLTFLFLSARGSAFLLPVVVGATMTGEPSPPPPAAALAAAKPDAMEERPPAAPPVPVQRAGGAASSAAGGAKAGTGGGGSTSPSHLVVLSHGLAGSADDLSYLKQSLERAGGPGVLVHSARCNQGKTKDGVAEGGGRLAKEILELVGSEPSLSRISLVGNSLGGLYVRYAAKLLYSNSDAGSPVGGATIAGLKPSVFMTIACPHLGVRRFTYVPLPSMLHPLAGVFVGKTGADLFLSRNSAATTTAAAAAAVNSNSSDGGSETVALPSSSRLLPSEPPSTTSSDCSIGDDSGDGTTTGGGGGGGGGRARKGAGSAQDGRESILLYGMSTSEEFLRPLKAFRWRRAYANRRGDFMVPYGTAAFLEPGEGDGSEEPVGGGGSGGGAGPRRRLALAAGADAGTGGAAAASAGVSAPVGLVGTGSFTLADRLLGAKSGAIVGVTRVGPAAPGAAAVGSGGQGEEPAQDDGGTGTSARIGGSAAVKGAAERREDKDRKSMEEEMAAGLNSCGWEKVSVDFGSLAPLSHNKICALSRTRITTALYGCGRSVVDHAADFLVARDIEGIDVGDSDDDGSSVS